MIVDLLDYRPGKPTESVLDVPEKSRVVLQPTAESIWADLCLLNDKLDAHWTDEQTLEMESHILVRSHFVLRQSILD